MGIFKTALASRFGLVIFGGLGAGPINWAVRCRPSDGTTVSVVPKSLMVGPYPHSILRLTLYSIVLQGLAPPCVSVRQAPMPSSRDDER